MTNEAGSRDVIWTNLYRRIVGVMKKYGREDACGEGDFWVVDDDYGWRRHTICIFNLNLFSPDVVGDLHQLLGGIPDWTIVLVLDVPQSGKEWPPMGVTIRRNEIIDGLLRQYLPAPFRALQIPGSRPGTGYD
ncbi:MAG: hypothetical protein JWR89_2227 [Tardiphaga sp.]|uniref:hypothetical protein n=1 Tax=Tardiphaga sp. TaxID=1926292 RepID=UPI00262228C1|nr:hypothetical protein [Tardiphaga sp.]MDB5502325.1 hypothetical protein [Tardiphaga sp.]